MGTTIRFVCALAVLAAVGTARLPAAGAAGEDLKEAVIVVKLRNVDAQTVATRLSDFLHGNPDVKIVVNEHTNSLSVRGPEKDIDNLKPLLILLERADRRGERAAAGEPSPPARTPSEDSAGSPPLTPGDASSAPGGRPEGSAPTPSAIDKMSDRALRVLVLSLYRQVQELQGRVRQLEERAGLQAEPAAQMRPLGGHLMVDERGVIWDEDRPVGIWGVDGRMPEYPMKGVDRLRPPPQWRLEAPR